MLCAHVPKYSNCEVCKLTKTARAPCRDHPEARGDRTHHPQKFGDATTPDHGVSTQGGERISFAASSRSRGTGSLLLLGASNNPTKNKMAQGKMKIL